jgi:hypothetical protein
LGQKEKPVDGEAGGSRVFGLYRDFGTLRSGVENLKALRFGNRDISVLFPEAAVAGTLSPQVPGLNDYPTGQEPAAFIGGLVDQLTYVRPERNGIIAAALAGFGVPVVDAAVFEEHLRKGELMVCVRSSSTKQVRNAEDALASTGAERVVRSRPSSEPGLRCADGAIGDRFPELSFMC